MCPSLRLTTLQLERMKTKDTQRHGRRRQLSRCCKATFYRTHLKNKHGESCVSCISTSRASVDRELSCCPALIWPRGSCTEINLSPVSNSLPTYPCLFLFGDYRESHRVRHAIWGIWNQLLRVQAPFTLVRLTLHHRTNMSKSCERARLSCCQCSTNVVISMLSVHK